MIIISVSLVSISAFLAILGKNSSKIIIFYIFKPLTTILVLLSAVFWGYRVTCEHKYLIYTGLFFSLIGDIMLMLKNKFILGLTSFFAAHISFAFAFILTTDSVHIGLFLPFLIGGIIVFTYLLTDLGKYKIPVFLYLISILLMSWRAWEVYHESNSKDIILLPVAALLFLISDLQLAIRNFKKSVRNSEIVILGTYYLAIWLIAVSVQNICK